MGNRYVNVAITRQTKATSQAGFGLSLILSNEKVMPYKEYTDVDAIGTDYGASSETFKLASKILGQSPRPEKVAVHGILFDKTSGVPSKLTEALNTLIKTQNNFFYLHCPVQSDAVITELAKWVDTQQKLYYASTINKTLYTTLKSQNTALLVHPNPETYPAAAWVGVCSPQEIGSYTWTFKTLNGILPATYDATDLATIEAGASSYIREGGVDLTSKGVTTTGEYIDIIQGQYFLTSRMSEAVFGLLTRLPKVSYTDGGIALVVAEVEGVLKRAANQGIIATDSDGNPLYTLTAPNAADVSAANKANRTLPDVNWFATIAGAVENVDINGVLQL